MPFNLEKFKTAYQKWVSESLPEYEAGRMTEIVKRYPFVVSDDIPWTPYRGRPSEQTFALVTSGGLFLKDSQPAFDAVSINGDPSLRVIPKSVSQKDIGIAHAHFDHSLAEQDIDIIFPIHRLNELAEEKIIGKVADSNYSFSYVNDVATLVTETIPEYISRIKAGGVDVVLLVPV